MCLISYLYGSKTHNIQGLFFFSSHRFLLFTVGDFFRFYATQIFVYYLKEKKPKAFSFLETVCKHLEQIKYYANMSEKPINTSIIIIE